MSPPGAQDLPVSRETTGISARSSSFNHPLLIHSRLDALPAGWLALKSCSLTTERECGLASYLRFSSRTEEATVKIAAVRQLACAQEVGPTVTVTLMKLESSPVCPHPEFPLLADTKTGEDFPEDVVSRRFSSQLVQRTQRFAQNYRGISSLSPS